MKREKGEKKDEEERETMLIKLRTNVLSPENEIFLVHQHLLFFDLPFHTLFFIRLHILYTL